MHTPYLNGEVAVHIPESKHNPFEIAKRHGYIYKGIYIHIYIYSGKYNLHNNVMHIPPGKVGSLDGYHLFEKAPEWTEEHPTFHNATEVKWFEHQIARPRIKRTVTPDPSFYPRDPNFHAQWHLENSEKYELQCHKTHMFSMIVIR